MLSLFSGLSLWQLIAMGIDYAIKFVMIGVVPSNRKPSSANAWLLLILLLPIVGLPLYLLMGSKYVSQRRHRIQKEARTVLNDVYSDIPDIPATEETVPEVTSMITLNRTLTGFPAVHGSAVAMWADYEKTMVRIAELVDKAEDYVDIEIYAVAWDNTTAVVFEALERAVDRGVHVRLLFDHIGSMKYPGFRALKRRLTDAGVHWHLMLPLSLLRGRFRRPDLRNHRKLIIIDGHTAMMGSMNLIDRTYLTRQHRAAGRQWVDAFVELQGPIVTSIEALFAVDWYSESGEPIELTAPLDLGAPADANLVQLIPSGPGYQAEPNLRMFNTLIHHAKEHLVLCSPYFVPEDSLLEAITTACYRGVRVDLLVGQKADQFMVQHAQSSYYQQLLEAGVRIWEFPAPYVLHTKFLLVDPASQEPGAAVGVLGSSNMDIRSFSLNYESSLLICDGPLLRNLNQLADTYLSVTRELTLERWNTRPWYRRYIDNVMKLTSALQ